MGIDDFQHSARYRQRLTGDLRLLFPYLSESEDAAIAKLSFATLEAAYESRRGELAQRFGPNLDELEVRQARLTSAFEHLHAFLDSVEAHKRRTGSDPRQVEAKEEPAAHRNVFLDAKRRARVIAVGGGKGGIGKSLVTANLAIALASLGRQVVAVDMDLGGADLHLSLGMHTLSRSLNDFIEHKYDDIDDVRLTTAYKNLSIIATDSGRLGAANIKFAHKEKILRHLGRLDCDIILIDLGAEVSFNVLDIFLAADHRYVVTSPEPTSVLEAYGLMKLSLYRKIRHFAGEMVPASSELNKIIDDFLFEKSGGDSSQPKNVWQLIEVIGRNDQGLQRRLVKILYNYTIDLIVNMSERESDIGIVKTFTRLCQDNLALNLHQGYRVPWDQRVRDAARKLMPVVIDAPSSGSAKALLKIAADLTTGPAAGASLSHRMGEIAVHARERVRKMREIAALNAAGEPVNVLMPLGEDEPRRPSRLRDFLRREIRFRK